MPAFRLLRAFNGDELRPLANSPGRIGSGVLPHFAGDSLYERIVRELAHERALPLKEVTEAFEFFAVVRKYLRSATTIVDLCSGHGLVGILFAALERRTQEVVLYDKRRPKSFEPVLRACVKAAPWIDGHVQRVELDLKRARTTLPVGSAVVGVHACGKLTDACIELGLATGGPFAVMPCCRAQACNPAPEGLRQALGEDVAYDVDRTYKIERHGCAVRWREIPAAITPMNRVLIAVPRAAPPTSHDEPRGVRDAHPDARPPASVTIP